VFKLTGEVHYQYPTTVPMMAHGQGLTLVHFLSSS